MPVIAVEKNISPATMSCPANGVPRPMLQTRATILLKELEARLLALLQA